MGLRKNLVYYSVLTLLQYIIGFITFPYISRVLGPTNIGIVSFVDNVINYFVLFSTVGINIIGTREIAKHKNDPDKMQIIVSSLLSLFLISTIIVLFGYFVAVASIPKLRIYKELLYIGAARVLFNAFLVEWFFKGVEDFKYITVRSIIIRVIFIASIFIFVRDKDDYIIYFILSTITVVVNSIINFSYLRRYIKISFKKIQINKYLNQAFKLGSYSILTSLYTTFNIIYLGWVSNSTQVGFYWAAITLYNVVLGFFTAFTGVMMPRMSNILSTGNENAFKEMIAKSFNGIFTISIPVVFGSIILAPQIISLLSGDSFNGAVVPMQIVMPLIFIVSIAQVLAVQVLMPLKRDSTILVASTIGAFVGIIFNILLVRKHGCVGTALVLLISETLVTSYYLFVTKRDRIIVFPWKLLFKNMLFSVPYIVICLISLVLFERSEIVLALAIFLSFGYFTFVHNHFMRNNELRTIINTIRGYFHHDNR